MADEMSVGAVCAGGLVALGATLDFLYKAEEKADFASAKLVSLFASSLRLLLSAWFVIAIFFCLRCAPADH